MMHNTHFCVVSILPLAEPQVGPDPDYRSRLRPDSAILFRTRIRTRSQKFVKNRTGPGVTFPFRQ